MNSPGGDSPYSKEQARGIFQAAFQDGSVIWTKHAREQMRVRNITTNDVLALARAGVVVNEPEPHIKTGQLNYRIESSDGSTKVVYEILSPRRIRIITVIAG